MKPVTSNRLLLLSCAAIIAATPHTTSAATLFWDGTDTTADADGGIGTWDTTSLNWDTLATAGVDSAWPSTGTDNIATFGAAAGAVTIDPGGVAANGLVFNTASYVIGGGPLTLNGVTPTVTSGVAATINSNLVGSAGLVKLGNGTLFLGGDNSLLTGPLLISGVTSSNDGGVRLQNNTAIGGLGPVTVDNNSFLGLTGVTLGSGVAISISGGGGTTAPTGAIRNNSGISEVNGNVSIANNAVRVSNIGGVGSSLTFNGAVTSVDLSHGLVVRNADGLGVIFTNPLNSWGGITDLAQGSVFFAPAALPATSILAVGSVQAADFGSNGTFTRALGSAAGEIRFAKANDGQRANGFSARGGDLTVNLGGAGADITFLNTLAKTAATTSTSPTVTVTDATGIVVGMSITGAGIPADTVVSAVVGTTITLNKAASATAAAAALTFYAPTDVTRYNSSVLVLNGANATGKLTLVNGLALNGARRTLSVANGPLDVDAEVSGIINGSGSSSLTKSGTGTLLLSAPNTYTGGTTIADSPGTANPLRISNSTALGTGTLTIGSAGNTDRSRLELIGGITVANTIATMASRSTASQLNFLNISGNNIISSGITVGSGGSHTSFQSDAGTLTFTGAINGRIINLSGAGNGAFNNNTFTLGTNGVTKSGTGTWTLKGTASYSGTTTISGGSLVAQRTTQLALGTGAVSVASGANLTITDHAGGGQLAYANALTLAGSGINGGGALGFFNSGLFNMSGPIAISGGTTIRTDPQGQTTAGTVTFTNVISGVDGLTLFSQGGAAGGRPGFALTAPSTYTGSTVLSSSGINTNPFVVTLSGGDNRLPVTTDLIFGGIPAGNVATFDKSVTLALAGISQEVAGIATANSPATAGGYRVVGASTTTATLVVNNPAAVTFNGVLGGGGTNQNNLAFTKNGVGNFSLVGSHTYTGDTTVAGGNLEVDSAFFDDDSAVTVATGATLTLNTGTNDVVSALIIGNTPLGDGIYTATSPQTSGILLGSGSLEVIGGTPYDTFTAGIANPADRGATDDPDADGIANGAEFVIGGNPAAGSDVGLLPTQIFVTADLGNGSTDYLKFTFRRTDISAYIAPGVEYDTDLSGIWTSATNGVSGVVIQTADDGFALGVDRVDTYIPVSLAASGKLFARLQVAVTP